MATFTAQLAKNGVAARMAHAMTHAKRLSTAAATALSSKRALPSALRGAAAGGPLPAAAARAAAPCCSAAADADVVELQLKVEGMVCDGCSSRVLEALQALSGVKSVSVDLEKGVATVEVAAASQTDAFNEVPRLIACVTDLGFDAQPHFE